MKTIIPTLFLLIGLSACKKNVSRINAPSCIKNKIEAVQQSSTSYTTQVDEYTFKNMKVYVFREDGIADGMSPVYDENCNQVCELGGITGNITCMGENFVTTSVFIRTVWKK
jgi:hypothetical protein